MNDEMLSQEELDALLAQHQSQKEPPEETAASPAAAIFDVDDFLSPDEQDTLGEIGNISMGSAATALSTLVNRKVSITVPDVGIATPRSLSESYPHPVYCCQCQLQRGPEGGQNILVIRERDALVIGNLMMGEDGTELPAELDEIYLSAVTEAMNMMMGGSASTAMSELFGQLIEITPPNRHAARSLARCPGGGHAPTKTPP